MLRILSLFALISLCSVLQAQTVLRITNPAAITGEYNFEQAGFGGQLLDSIEFDLVYANNGAGNTQGCDTIQNVSNKIVFIDRGSCDFVRKIKKAQNSGAVMAIICNNAGGTAIFNMSGFDPSIKIPGIMLSQNDCAKIKLNLSGAKGKLVFKDPTKDEVVLYSEEFNGGSHGWTTKGISNVRDTFMWAKDGVSRGALNTFFIDAPTKNNGSMIFDADFLTTNGDTNNIPAGLPPYPNHVGELISPVINCSSFNSVTLKFFETFVAFIGTSYYATSIDGGATWSNQLEINEDFVDGTPRGKFLKIDLPQLANQALARIKFIFDGDFYVWILDDIKLLGKSAFDIAVQPKQFFFPFSFATPASQITTDTSTFSADIANFGSLAGGNLKMRVQVTNNAGAILHQDSLMVINLPSGARDTTFFFTKSYIPGKLDPGIYTITYSIEGAPGSLADADPTNNSQSQNFLVTTNLFAKDDGDNIVSGLRALNGGDYFFGNIYMTSTDWKATDKFSASEVTFAAFMQPADGMLKGKPVTIYLAELLPTIASDFNNFDLVKSVTENPAQIKIVGIGTYEFTQNQSEIATVTLQDFTTFNDKVALKKGTRYLLGVSYKDAASKAYQYVDTDIQYFYIGTILYAGGQWSQWTDGAVIRMSLDISTPVDELPLPEYTLQLSPNPATDYIRAKVNFEKNTDANFVLVDISGKVLQMQSKKGVLKETFEFDTKNLASGTYLMRISTDEGTKTKKFIVQR